MYALSEGGPLGAAADPAQAPAQHQAADALPWQNILGYKHYADDVVDAFCRKSIENGIDIIRIFDALNDVRNLEQAIKSTKKYGGIVEATLSYTISPIHNEDYFVKLAKELEQMGADTLCIKDMANLLLPMTPTPWSSG